VELISAVSTPHVLPAADGKYRDTLDRLTQLTTNSVRQYLTGKEGEGAAIVSAAAQQVNPSVKIDAVIA
jgi:hypothetical protein